MGYVKGRVLISEEEIREKVRELGAQISRDYKGKKVIFVCVLKGAAIFFTDLLREISEDVDARFDFLAISSYGASTKSSGVVKIQKDLTTDIQDKNVIIVEDILDTGLTGGLAEGHCAYKACSRQGQAWAEGGGQAG